MKKILPVLMLTVLVWSCAKKISPSQSETPPASNTGSVINNESKSAENNTGMASTGQTPTGNTGITGTKTADQKEKSAEETAAISGQATYNAKCGRCHGLKATIDYTAERWASILSVMAPRAHLSEVEKENVYAYVKANAKK